MCHYTGRYSNFVYTQWFKLVWVVRVGLGGLSWFEWSELVWLVQVSIGLHLMIRVGSHTGPNWYRWSNFVYTQWSELVQTEVRVGTNSGPSWYIHNGLSW